MAIRVTGPDADPYRVERLWFPWRRRVKDVPDTADGGVSLDGLGDDPISLVVFALVLVVLVVPVLLVLVLATLEIILLVLLMVPFVVARSLVGVPWTIRVRRHRRTVRLEQVRGWGESRRRMADLAEEARTGRLTLQDA